MKGKKKKNETKEKRRKINEEEKRKKKKERKEGIRKERKKERKERKVEERKERKKFGKRDGVYLAGRMIETAVETGRDRASRFMGKPGYFRPTGFKTLHEPLVWLQS